MTDKKEWDKKKVDVALSNQEISATIDLLEFAISTFEVMSKTAEEHQDLQSLGHLQVRLAFARALALKLATNMNLEDLKKQTFH